MSTPVKPPITKVTMKPNDHSMGVVNSAHVRRTS